MLNLMSFTICKNAKPIPPSRKLFRKQTNQKRTCNLEKNQGPTIN